MSSRDRRWLRGFLRLTRPGTVVAARDVERQEDTVLRALELLESQPGVVLADEVGMGKTFEALGVLAARLEQRPEARALILTPGPDLNTKWAKELRDFCDPQAPMYRGFAGRFTAARTLAELTLASRSHSIVIAPVTVFIGGRGASDQAYLLSLWGQARDLAGNQLAAVFRRYREGALSHVQVERERLLDAFAWSEVEPHVAAVMEGHQRMGRRSLDALWRAHGYEAFANKEAVDQALADLRFRLIGSMLPSLDLLIVDEAHKLKSADSVRTTGVKTAFEGRFDRALFLTATPFQLSVDELRSVFELFALARSAPADLMDQADRLLADVAGYQQAYQDFQRVWATADGALAADFASWLRADPGMATDPQDAVLRPIAQAARRLLTHKRDRIEPHFRRWMIRSLREDKRQYRRSHRARLRARDGLSVPFLLYERLIAELFRSGTRTHKAAAQINLVSSFGAARAGALLTLDPEVAEATPAGEGEAYRRLLRKIVGQLRDEDEGHPKIDHVVADALAAVARDEKTLIFCARKETLRELKRRIEDLWEQRMVARWQLVYPGASHRDIFEHQNAGRAVDGHHSRLRDRFGSPKDALYLALRERYVGTLLRGLAPTEAQRAQIVARANQLLRQQRVGRSHAERFDWLLAKRCVEQAAALMVRELGADDDVDAQALDHLTDARFVTLGYDLVKDDVEAQVIGEQVPTWSIDDEHAQLILQREQLWSFLVSPLLEVPPELRVRTVERLASYLVARNVPFLPELLAFARDQGLEVERIESRALLPVVDRFWTSPAGRPWTDLIRRFLTYANGLGDQSRREVLDDAVNAGGLVRHTVDGESRERLREAFNTPLYPMVLVANEVMQEGLDLHHHCRRVVHHDLAWNPAQLEQRVGRVDRLGSLVQKLRAKDGTTTLDVLLPLVANTIDERLDRTVRQRERWLEVLLGAADTRLDDDVMPDQPSEPLPEQLAEALQIDLGPGLAASN